MSVCVCFVWGVTPSSLELRLSPSPPPCPVCVCVCVFGQYTSMHIHRCCVCMIYMCVRARVYVCVRTCIRVCARTCRGACRVYIFVRIMYTYICICKHTHTHTHTFTLCVCVCVCARARACACVCVEGSSGEAAESGTGAAGAQEENYTLCNAQLVWLCPTLRYAQQPRNTFFSVRLCTCLSFYRCVHALRESLLESSFLFPHGRWCVCARARVLCAGEQSCYPHSQRPGRQAKTRATRGLHSSHGCRRRQARRGAAPAPAATPAPRDEPKGEQPGGRCRRGRQCPRRCTQGLDPASDAKMRRWFLLCPALRVWVAIVRGRWLGAAEKAGAGKWRRRARCWCRRACLGCQCDRPCGMQ